MTQKLPALFVGHGNPMNAIDSNRFTEAWKRLAKSLPKPKSILAISAHWHSPEIAVTASPKPPTLHDFAGFPPALHRVNYPAPGDPLLARRIQSLLNPLKVTLDSDRGLDHGVWSVLLHLYPAADIPVVQLSLDESKHPSFHFDLGAKLSPLRDEGVLILGTGNLVHNLQAVAWGVDVPEPYAWALRFEENARRLLVAGDFQKLLDYRTLGSDALLSVPTPEHLLPLFYVLATKQANEPISFPVEGFDRAAISMLSVQVG
ncbi:MAG TPA: 4,5-DOPA dioxygenase extradiol [Candidatus Acidoferrum sp.]|nr:4,5-DOPA dioxygenase extradiol [Candidatus Acidoferrum sp.]